MLLARYRANVNENLQRRQTQHEVIRDSAMSSVLKPRNMERYTKDGDERFHHHL